VGAQSGGPRGYLQSLADGIKLALKEPITPIGVDRPIFFLAPIISTIRRSPPSRSSHLPAGIGFQSSDTATGNRSTVAVLFILAFSAVGVYGIVLAGWASGSTYPLLGGVRSTAQMISYEVAMGLSFGSVPLRRNDVDVADRGRARPRLVRLPATAVVHRLSRVDGG